MKINIREGIVLTKICGVYFLIPTREASEYCPLIGRPGLFELMCWEGLSKGKTEEELCQLMEKAFKKSPEDARNIIGTAIKDLSDKGYVICEPNEATV